MTLNKDTGIDWCDASWNPASGCKHGCEYCYARKMAVRYNRSFEPAYHPERLGDIKRVTEGIIFVGSNCDLFGAWVPAYTIQSVLVAIKNTINANNKAAFMFLTKNPARYALMVELYPALKDRNIWLGTTLDKGYSSNAPTNEERLDAINNLDYPRKWVSMEPLAPKLIDWYKEQIHGLDIQWLVVGFRTNPGPVLARRDLANLQFLLDIPIKQNIPVFVKASVFEQDHKLRNFQYTWPREFPDGVQLATKPAAWSPKERVVKT